MVVCNAFDIRCIPCEIEGEGTVCEVDDLSGVCLPMRTVVGPQLVIEGMRCRAE
jgi:hypothetical protein